MAHARERSKIIIVVFLMRILFKVFPLFYNLRTQAVAECQL